MGIATKVNYTMGMQESRRVNILQILLGVALAVIAVSAISGCATVAGGSGAVPAPTSDDSSAAEQNATAGDAANNREPPQENEPVFRVTEDYWVDTPWFSVSSIVLRVGRRSPQTTIVLPESSIMRDYMRGESGVVIADSFEAQRNQFLLSLGFQMEGAEPFVDEARLRQSFIYD